MLFATVLAAPMGEREAVVLLKKARTSRFFCQGVLRKKHDNLFVTNQTRLVIDGLMFVSVTTCLFLKYWNSLKSVLSMTILRASSYESARKDFSGKFTYKGFISMCLSCIIICIKITMGAIMERRKYLGRANEKFIKTFTSQIIRIDEENISGYAALVKIEKAHHAFFVGNEDFKICIADNGYSELCWLPDNENWQVYAIYDDKNCIVEWYFDITRKNAVDEKGTPYADDIYLDAALMPDGRVLILDEDELRAALDNGNIAQDEFDMAYRVLNRLIEDKFISIDFMEQLCTRLFALFE